MEYSLESKTRIKKIQDLKDAWIIPYANNYRGKQDIDYIISEKNQAKDADVLMESWAIWEYKTAWRLVWYRSFWKLSFWKLLDHKWDIQISFVRDKVEFNTGRKIIQKDKTISVDGIERSPFKIIEKLVDTGDYIWVIWDLFVTKHWELTLFVKEFQILAKAVRPLPEKFHWVTDQETIYRQRYLDLITNQESYDRMVLKSSFIKSLRDFYIKNDFVEISTPILGTSASWAAAAPFITKHNDFGEDVVLRIAPEPGLKMATVWRFERVFEFGPNFRNEGSDPSHMQEFHVVEHYAAWWNAEDNMTFMEDMFDHFFDELKLERKIPVKDKEWNEKIVDFKTPFERINYTEAVNKASGLNILDYKHWDEQKLISDIKAKGIDFEGMESMAVPTLIDYLYKKVLRPSITWPAYIYNFPKALAPLARQNDENWEIVEQFQLLVNGWEIFKAYSELVDPKIQTQNFDSQSWAIELWDEEATQWDDEFVLAMEYGMPCQSGMGMWFDRIFSILTQQDNLRDVVLFPLMKSEKKKTEKEIETEKWLKLRAIVEEFWSEEAMKKLNKAFWKKEEDNNNSLLNPLSLQEKGATLNSLTEVPTREKILEMVDKYCTSTKQHNLQVWDIMEYFAEKLWEDTHYWWTVWTLHDIDWDYIGKDGNAHCKEEFIKMCHEFEIPESIIKDVQSHLYWLDRGLGIKPDTLVRKYLSAVDELSGFMWAYFRMTPYDDPKDLKPKSIKKKIKDKRFAAGVSREEVKNCETLLNIDLGDFINDVKVGLAKGEWEK